MRKAQLNNLIEETKELILDTREQIRDAIRFKMPKTVICDMKEYIFDLWMELQEYKLELALLEG